LILLGLLGGFYEGFCHSGDLLVGVVKNDGHLLKLRLWWRRFEGLLFELLGQVVSFGFGVLAATDFIAPEPAGVRPLFPGGPL